MQTITLNGKLLKITAAEQRALEILRNDNWVSGSNRFEEGPRRYRKYILPRDARAAILGVGMVYRDEQYTKPGPRAARFFADTPRRRQVVTGNPRRINAILNQL